MHPLDYKVIFQDFEGIHHYVSVSGWGEDDVENRAYQKFDECAIVLSVLCDYS